MAEPDTPRKPRRKAGSGAAAGGSNPPRKRAVKSRAAPPPPPERRWPRLTVWVGLAILVLDQLSKIWVVHVMQLRSVLAIDLLPPWLNLRMAWNQGVNFGLFASSQELMRWVLIAVALAVCVWVWLWLARARAGRLAQVAGGLLIGGAVGNVIDRVLYGAVADFLNMSLPNWQNPYSFNVADIAIFAGALGLILQPPPGTEEPGREGGT